MNIETALPIRPKICSICGCAYTGFGHNAEPVNSGRCCDICNNIIVIPTRIRNLQHKIEEDFK
jgi:hypothetical protein